MIKQREILKMASMFELLTFAFLNLLGAMSPGPDFAIVTRYGLTGSRKAALLATLGIASALLIHVLYCLLGIDFLQNSPVLFTSVRLIGALYLGYLGFKMTLSFRTKTAPHSPVAELQTHRKAFANGFLTNLLNPKATLFLVSLFTQFVSPTMALPMKIAFGATIPLIAFGWFALLSYFLTHPQLLPYLQRYQKGFTFTIGLLLLALSLSVFTSLFV